MCMHTCIPVKALCGAAHFATCSGQLPNAANCLGLVQGVLHSFTANQCSKLTAVVLRLPKAAPLRHLSLSGNCACVPAPRGTAMEFVLEASNHCLLHCERKRANAGVVPAQLCLLAGQSTQQDGSACPGCSALRRLDLAAERLQGLNVSGCGALEELGIACPALESLAMAQCARLEALPGPPRCPVLRTANLAGCSALEGTAHDNPEVSNLFSGFPRVTCSSVGSSLGLLRCVRVFVRV